MRQTHVGVGAVYHKMVAESGEADFGRGAKDDIIVDSADLGCAIGDLGSVRLGGELGSVATASILTLMKEIQGCR